MTCMAISMIKLQLYRTWVYVVQEVVGSRAFSQLMGVACKRHEEVIIYNLEGVL